MDAKQTAKQVFLSLAERFRLHQDTYKHVGYNEAQTRSDFIDPFWEALGWDVTNRAGNAEAYREVVHEAKVRVEGKSKSPDYLFTLSGREMFYLEAKKPHIDISIDSQAAFQVRRYGYSGKHKLCVLTNFHQLAVYDCSVKPSSSDKAHVARVRLFSLDQIAEHFDWLWDTFSRENLPKGSLDKFVASEGFRKGTSTLDEDFLAQMEHWRHFLATGLALDNKTLSEPDLNFYVQLILDRILFLRIAEARGLEDDKQLSNLLKGDIWANLHDLFDRCAPIYNSDLFAKARTQLTRSLTLKPKVLKDIIQELYPPKSPFEFSVIPSDILGAVYERFLGKVLRIRPNRSVVVEEKPEVRKAGGVYYTPKYIVDYIVAQTVGKLLEDKTPETLQPFFVLDPACGSGTFLVGAYEYLIDWHRRHYEAGHKPPAGVQHNLLNPDGRLSAPERKRILQAHIHGVDLDPQATEVAKLNLLLKCLEFTTPQDVRYMVQERRQPLLPHLDPNLRCGNSLVGPDVYDLLPEAPPAELDALRPLSWQAAFPHVFRLGGFHAVVGNPPYVRQELLGPHNKDYFRASYQVYHGVADLYSYFFELGARILLPGGLFGIIVANKWMRANYGEPLRRFLGGLHVVQVIDFGDLPVFATATTYPCVVVYENAPAPPTPVRAATPTRLHFPAGLAQWVVHNQFEVARAQLQPSGWALQTNAHHALLHKLRSAGTPLGEYVGGKIYYGIKTGLNEAFVVDAPTRAHLLAQDPRSSEVLRPFLAGRDVKRYQTPNPTKWLILLPKGWTRALFESTSLPHISLTEELAFQLLESNYPAIAGWLAPFRERGIKRTDKGEFWWELRACDYYPEFEKPKIIYPNISKGPIFTLDENQVYTNQKCFIITQFHFGLLGFLNSKLSYFLYENFLPKLRGGFHEPSSLYFLKFPVPNNLASLDQPVTTLLQLHRDLAAAALPHDQELIRHRIAHLDHQLDQLVYGLYGLTPAEIALIEASLAP